MKMMFRDIFRSKSKIDHQNDSRYVSIDPVTRRADLSRKSNSPHMRHFRQYLPENICNIDVSNLNFLENLYISEGPNYFSLHLNTSRIQLINFPWHIINTSSRLTHDKIFHDPRFHENDVSGHFLIEIQEGFLFRKMRGEETLLLVWNACKMTYTIFATVQN